MSVPASVQVESKVPVASGTNAVKEESAEDGQNGGHDQHMYSGEQGDDEDEIDFNLGNGNGNTFKDEYDDGAHHQRGHGGPGIKEDG